LGCLKTSWVSATAALPREDGALKMNDNHLISRQIIRKVKQNQAISEHYKVVTGQAPAGAGPSVF